MFNNILEITECINKDVNIASSHVTSIGDKVCIELYTNWFSYFEAIKDDEFLEQNLKDLLNRIGTLVKLNNYISGKSSLLDLKFIYSRNDYITMINYDKIEIYLCKESINRLPLDALETEVIADSLLDSINIVELLKYLSEKKILDSYKDIFSALSRGMNTINDVISAVKGKSKGKLTTKVLLMVEDLAIIALLNIDILLDTRNISVSVLDDKVISLDTGAVLADDTIRSVIIDRTTTHLRNSI